MAWQIARARHIFAPWCNVDAAHAVAFDEERREPDNLAAEHLALVNASAAKEYHIAPQSRQKGD